MKGGWFGPNDTTRGIAAAFEVSKSDILDGKIALNGTRNTRWLL
jgi:hypothetical protein